MVVGVCVIELFIPNSGSLKEKRHVLQSIKMKIKNKFNVAIAEVDGGDLWQRVALGVVTVANDRRYVNQILDKVVASISGHPEVEVIGRQMEFI